MFEKELLSKTLLKNSPTGPRFSDRGKEDV